MTVNRLAALLFSAAVACSPLVANAHKQGDWLVRVGASNVDPKSDNHPLVSVDDQVSLTFDVTYMYSSNIGLELLASAPFEHDITIDGTRVADTKHLPPTFSLQWHFLPDGAIQPYVGLGLNYTRLFSESTFGPLAGANLSLDDSWGFATQVGVDVPIGDTWFVNGVVRYIDIETDAKLDGIDIGTVKIDPWVYGLHFGRRF